ncbi:MAG TPA: heavy metal translocating P-type ATPase, partial [Clostridiales bacterium]|nr:heavy metal translocating P-type ATPase [Clostridiales bacterium]
MVLERIFPEIAFLSIAVFIIGYLILGGEVVLRALKNISKGQIFDENFLMSIATVGAFLIGDFAEAVAVMLFYQVGEYFQDAAVRKSKKSITSLMDIRDDYANLKRGNDTEKVAPETVKIGDLILVRPGEKIPLDGTVLDGESMLDTSALTGESVPRSIKKGEAVLAGCINQSGVLTIEVIKEFGESTVAKIIDLVENASSKKAPSENFITTFSRYYTPVVVGVAILLALIPPLFFNGAWSDWI